MTIVIHNIQTGTKRNVASPTLFKTDFHKVQCQHITEKSTP